MSQENVDVVLAALPRFEAEDFEALERVMDANVRVTGPQGWPEPGPFEGREAVIGQFRRLTSEMGEHRFKDVEVVADRDDWVVIRFIWEVRGAGSGAPIASRMAAAYEVVEDTFKQVHFRWTPEEALAAAGLRE
jgi:hypothetical protein